MVMVRSISPHLVPSTAKLSGVVPPLTSSRRTSGLIENADLGITLAAATADMFSWVPDSDSKSFPFTKGWYDAYLAWNMIYVSNFGNFDNVGTTMIRKVLVHHYGTVVWHVAQLLFSLFLSAAFGFLQVSTP